MNPPNNMSSLESVDRYIDAALNQFNVIVKHPKVLEVVSESLYDELLDEIILGIAYDAHRSFKRGYLNLYPDDFDPALLEAPEGDAFGHQESVKCVCPKCHQRVGALKFAAHLTTCMGLGRNSSRIANMKLTSSKDRESTLYANAASDDETDADWGEKKRKKKDNRNSNKRKQKLDNHTSLSRSLNNSFGNASTLKALINDEKPKQICGVITKHSKKKCKNINCSHHTEQRKAMKCEGENFTIDVESNEDMGSDVRDSMDISSNNSSPADSSNSSSRKRDKSSKTKSKSSKKGSRRSLSS